MSAQSGVDDGTRYETMALARIEDVLTAEFSGRVSRQLVALAVAAARARFQGAVIGEYVPVLVERQVRAELNRTTEPG